jgi:hypothetical protein
MDARSDAATVGEQGLNLFQGRKRREFSVARGATRRDGRCRDHTDRGAVFGRYSVAMLFRAMDRLVHVGGGRFALRCGILYRLL